MNRRRVGAFLGILAFTVAFVAAAPSAQAQSGTITGTVTDRVTSATLRGVRLLLEGSNKQAVTDDQGRYTLIDVPDGPATVRAIIIGYNSVTAQITVTGGVGTADFRLQTAVVNLDDIVVTATGQTRKREVVNAIANIQAAEVVETAMPPTVASLIQGRASGVQIINSSGTVGTNTKIRIRGSSSISLSNDPLIVVDGIRVENGACDLSVNVGGQCTSRINDFNPDDIESIEIVKGPSAAALYGTAAANGVIVIHTKKGFVGQARWNIYGEGGVSNDITTWPANYRGVDSAGDTCRNEAAAAGTCTQSAVETANPLTGSRNPFKMGNRYQVGANVAGGTNDVQYYVSGEFEKELGIYTIPQATKDSIVGSGLELPSYANNPNRLARANVRVNLQARLNNNMDLNVSTGYLSSNLNLPQNDNNSFGMLPSGLLGSADSTNNTAGYGFFLPEEVFFVEVQQGIERFTGSGDWRWRPTSWLAGHVTAGVDFTQRSDVRFQANGFGPDAGTRRQGSRRADKTNTWQYTLDVGLNAQYRVGSSLTGKTAVGLQYYDNQMNQIETDGDILAPGSGSQKAATLQVIDEDFRRIITAGVFIDQSIGFNDVLFANLALRADDNSAFGQNLGTTYYPKVGLSWVALDQGNTVSSFRLRGAYGHSGQHPAQNTSEFFLNGTTVVSGGSSVVGVTIGGAGNADLKPERSAEIEAGFDAGFFNDRVGLEFTYYNRTTTDALVDRRLAPSLGLTQSRQENIGKTNNFGIEATINATIIESNAFAWDLTIGGSTNTNKLVELGEGVDPITQGTQRFVEGYPLGGYWQKPVDWSDANGDGIIAPDELVVGDTSVFIGYPRPRYEAVLSNTFSLGRHIRLSGLWDYRGGNKLEDLTENFRCRFNNCQGINDRNAPLELQARAAATDASSISRSLDIVDAWFIKLRELSLSFTAPDSWANAIRADRMFLTFTGRNLVTITDYPGIDPELQGSGSSNFGSREFLTQPQVRSFLVRLQLTY